MSARLAYAFATLIAFCVEIYIALFVHDRLIRPYLGDGLAVVLVYLLLRVVTPWPVLPAAIVSFLVAAAIEFGQLFHLLDALGLGGSRLARLVLGTSFDPKDFIAYFLGAAGVLAIEACLDKTVRSA